MTADPHTAGIQIPDHTLLRVIGRGSYGEVWLARNVMGTLRAVKIVRRAAFDSDRPWLREFEGIRRCEPVSRAHDGLVDILHMGRNDAEGFFYYVMELADAAGGPDDYSPATLSARLESGRALGAGDCLRLAESLAGALAFLHEQGLIHRDVKPSNVLYAGSVPKLADIGLVAETGSSRSFVGTEGFVPLEGPGTERADIFALGKVLYEALTGLDREKFPRLPEWWAGDVEFEQRVELNEIVLRACEGDPARRYHTAREMLADVALVASGRSVKKLRSLERRLKALRGIGIGAALLAALGLGSSWLISRQASRERALRHAALLDQVHAARHDPTPGAVTRALHTASEAAALGVTAQLRDDAIYLLGRPDFVERPELSIGWAIRGSLRAIDAGSGLAAEAAPAPPDATGSILVTLHVAGAPDKSKTLTVPGPGPWLHRIELARGGSRLLLTGPLGSGTVIDTASGGVIATIPQPEEKASPLRFCGHAGDLLVCRAPRGGLASFRLPGGERGETPPIAVWPVGDQQRRLPDVWPSPDGKRVLLIDTELSWPPLQRMISGFLPPHLAKSTAGTACLVETGTGKTLWRWTGADEQTAAWSDDGTRIALRSGERIQVLDAADGSLAASVPYPLYSRGTALCFLHDRNHLVFRTLTENGLCELNSARLLCHPPVAGAESYSAARRLLLCENGAAEWRPSKVLRTFHPRPLREHPATVSCSPDDACLIAGDTEAFTLWRLDEEGGVPAAVWPAKGAGKAFFPPGAAVEFHAADGIRYLPWESGSTAKLPAEPPPVSPSKLPGARRGYSFSNSLSGRIVGVGGDRFACTRSLDLPNQDVRYPASDTRPVVAVSSDGSWFAAGGDRSTGVQIWRENHPETTIHVESTGPFSAPAFSPDGRWLAIANPAGTRFLECGSWRSVEVLPRFTHLYLSNPVTFSPDSRFCVVQPGLAHCAFVECGTWATRFHIQSPADKLLTGAALSPGGRFFVAAGTRQEIFVWDLQAMERELQALGLSAKPL